jgi:hypothetical protein
VQIVERIGQLFLIRKQRTQFLEGDKRDDGEFGLPVFCEHLYMEPTQRVTSC